MPAIRLRPHHILDIVTRHGHGLGFAPHRYGHALHSVAQALLANLEQEIELVIGTDEVCAPCRHRRGDGRCDDVLRQLDPPPSKQAYNDALDRRLLAQLGLAPGTVMTAREYLVRVSEHIPGIERLCAHPEEDEAQRLGGLRHGGLERLGLA